jgi:hypothetical protein
MPCYVEGAFELNDGFVQSLLFEIKSQVPPTGRPCEEFESVRRLRLCATAGQIALPRADSPLFLGRAIDGSKFRDASRVTNEFTFPSSTNRHHVGHSRLSTRMVSFISLLHCHTDRPPRPDESRLACAHWMISPALTSLSSFTKGPRLERHPARRISPTTQAFGAIGCHKTSRWG